MSLSVTSLLFDWQFWAAVVAAFALVLSQLPPVVLWFRPRRLELEVHSRVHITHKVGNPNVGIYVSLRNTGGRELLVRSMELTLSRDGAGLGTLQAQNYFEQPTSQTPVLLVPFSLKPGDTWAHATNFLNLHDRTTDRGYRASLSALEADIRRKLQARAPDDNRLVVAEGALVDPFIALFTRLFIWQPGEYVAALVVNAEPGSASYVMKYRFTLFESDSAEMKAHTEDYKFGAGIAYREEKHARGLDVPIAQLAD